MTLNNSMSITPSPPGQAKGAKFEHGSVLGGKTLDARVSSQWKSTLSLSFLSPALVKAAVEARLSRGFGVKRLMDLPIAWSDQWSALGLQASGQT
jgi:hypothetical protein